MNIIPSPGCKNSPKNQLVEQLSAQILSQQLLTDFIFVNYQHFDLSTIKTIEYEATISHGAHGSCIGLINSIPFSMHIEFEKPSKLILKKAHLFIGK